MAANELDAAGFVEGSELKRSPGCNLAVLGDATEAAFRLRHTRLLSGAQDARDDFLRIVIPLYLFV
ncbi:MAG: hypothetical protein H0V72_30065 [Bradyrhizobium sp.]|nr:hypothetical protein [Bradyrhizobium sp.]